MKITHANARTIRLPAEEPLAGGPVAQARRATSSR